MTKLTLQHAMDENKRLLENATEPLRVMCLRNITMEGIKPFLDYYILRLGYKPEVSFCQYDNIMQDVLNSDSSLYQSKPHVIVLVIKLENYLPALVSNFCSLQDHAWKSSLSEIQDYFSNIIRAIRGNGCTVPILMHNFEVPTYPAFGILDAQDEKNQLGFFPKQIAVYVNWPKQIKMYL